MDIFKIMEERFNKHNQRHKNIEWEDVVVDLHENIDRLTWMEETGGEPDLIIYKGKIIVLDMAKESPKGRRSMCYDKKARINRKKFPPKSSVLETCNKHNVSLVNKDLYEYIQSIEPLDLKTSSWVLTGAKIRELGGALFCDRRYDEVFVYHNGADSYYGARGFRTYFEL